MNNVKQLPQIKTGQSFCHGELFATHCQNIQKEND